MATRAAAPAAMVGRGRAWSAGQSWLWATVSLTLGALGVMIALAPPAGAPATAGLTWLLFVGSSVHVAATCWLYTLGDVRAHARAHPRRYVWVPLSLIAVGGVSAALLAPSRFTCVLLAYVAWQFMHFQKQNLGLAALAASATGARRLSRLERRALAAAGVAGIAGIVAHPGLVQLPEGLAVGWLFAPAAGVFGCTVVVGMLALRSRSRPDRPPGYCAVFVGSLLFFVPVFACDSPYAAVGALTVAHGLQYLLLVGLVAGGTTCGRPRGLQIVLLVNVAVLGGAALNTASHLHNAAPVGRVLFGAYLGVAMAHFVVDAGLWRLRDPFARRWLSARVPYLVAPESQAQ